ncbi:histidinol-phosphate transaminase [Nocardia jejuensis]|uniref:histidinol-phosphate transaminase n=1 Tax=Nocardia jejuensis TaxID=328049 RepID=UPI0008299A6F|nr:histidinol-phosphate transaminase [Nocardia jejuensis]
MTDTPRLREALHTLPDYSRISAPPTGPDTHAFTLSANEIPGPPLPEILETAVQAAASANRYPDISCADLTAELARTFDVPASHVATGTGSTGVLLQLLHATTDPGDEVIYAWRSFEAYPILTRIRGADPVEVPLSDERHDLDAMVAAISPRTRLIIVCNPNNPSGTAVHRQELCAFLDAVPSDVLVVLDEAYREFVTDPDVPDGLELYRNRPNVAVLRTFSKAYGLAGLRVGFAVAHDKVAKALRQTAVPFGITRIGQDAAVAALRADNAMRLRVQSLVRERERVVEKLTAQGWQLPRTQANFVWLRLDDRTSELTESCVRQGLSVRSFAGEGVRVTIGDPEANDLFLKVTANFHRSPALRRRSGQ